MGGDGTDDDNCGDVCHNWNVRVCVNVDNNNIEDGGDDHILNKVGLPHNKMMGLAMLHIYLAPFLVTLPRWDPLLANKYKTLGLWL